MNSTCTALQFPLTAAEQSLLLVALGDYDNATRSARARVAVDAAAGLTTAAEAARRTAHLNENLADAAALRDKLSRRE